jgi:hypothetical protein
MLIPVLLLIGTGLFLHQRERLEAEKFRPVVERIKVEKRLRTKGSDRTVRVMVFVGQQGTVPKGTVPKWWGQNIKAHFGRLSHSYPNPRSGGALHTGVLSYYLRTKYNAKLRQYVLTFSPEDYIRKGFVSFGDMEGELIVQETPGSPNTVIHNFKKAIG